MNSFGYNYIAILALISTGLIMLIRNKKDRSLIGFLILYGINFLIILFIFWIVKI